MTEPSETMQEHLTWLFAQQRFGVKPGLERVRALLELVGEPQRGFDVVLVGGTNGKGSTASTLASILRVAGRQAGLFTSPHLTRFPERFLVNGAEVPESDVLAALRELRPLAERVGATFFEVVTVLGCLLFARAGVQVAVMEVGLGGRLDSTNALEPLLSVVTNIGLDHTAILGETKALIAGEKAGILRRGRPAVVGVEKELLPCFDGSGADLWALGREFTMQTGSLGWAGSQVTVNLPATSLTFETLLLGAHGARNAALGAAAAYRLGVDSRSIAAGTASTVWPGRMEVLPWHGGRVLLDGAHNPDGAAALVTALRELGVGRVPVIFGAASDKDVAGVASHLAGVASRVILTRAALSPRAADPAELGAFFPGVPVTVTQTPAQALAAVRGEALSVACGSLYLIGELRPLLLGEQPEAWERWQ